MFKLDLTHLQRKMILILICIIFLVSIIWFVFTVKFVSWDFRNELWAPTYLFWQGESPYNTTIVFPISLAVWFPQIIGVFLPLGLLSEYQATNLWLLMNTGLIVYLTWFVTKQVSKEKPTPLLFSILLVSVFLFPPTFRLLKLGQVDILFIIATIIGANKLMQRQLISGAFFFALALTKPQLSILVLPCLVIYWLFIKKDWQRISKFILIIFLFILALSLPLWISSKTWLFDFISNLMHNPSWIQPSTFFQLRLRMGDAGVFLWSLLYITVLIISLGLWKHFGSSYAILWSIALTTIVSPYIWSWDFTLLLPLFVDTATRLTNHLSRAVLFTFYILSIIFTVISLNSGIASGDDVLWWFPILILIGIICTLKLAGVHIPRRQNTRPNPEKN